MFYVPVLALNHATFAIQYKYCTKLEFPIFIIHVFELRFVQENQIYT